MIKADTRYQMSGLNREIKKKRVQNCYFLLLKYW